MLGSRPTKLDAIDLRTLGCVFEHNGELVAKAAAVLQTFTPRTTTLSVRQLADRTGIPRSTVHRLCTSLCDAGLLERCPGAAISWGRRSSRSVAM